MIMDYDNDGSDNCDYNSVTDDHHDVPDDDDDDQSDENIEDIDHNDGQLRPIDQRCQLQREQDQSLNVNQHQEGIIQNQNFWQKQREHQDCDNHNFVSLYLFSILLKLIDTMVRELDMDCSQIGKKKDARKTVVQCSLAQTILPPIHGWAIHKFYPS